MPSTRHKLSHQKLVLLAVGALVLLVVIISAAAVSGKPTTTLCQFSCGPDVGPRLAGQTVYSDSQFGYRVEYESPPFSVAQKGGGTVVLQANFGVLVEKAASGTDVTGLMKSVLGGLSTNEFQNMQQVSASVPGAEIGYVPGQGQVYTAQFTPSGGGQASTFVIVLLGATNGNLSMAIMAVAPQDLSSVSQLPFGVTAGSLFDFEVSNTIWPGQ